MSRVLWRRHTDSRTYEVSVSTMLAVGVEFEGDGVWSVSVGPFEFWTARR